MKRHAPRICLVLAFLEVDSEAKHFATIHLNLRCNLSKAWAMRLFSEQLGNGFAVHNGVICLANVGLLSFRAQQQACHIILKDPLVS